MSFIEPYQVTVLVLGLTGFLFWLQLAMVDVVGIKNKHTPGYLIEQDHNNFLFRAHRVLANSNESAAILILFALFAMLSSADAIWLNRFALIYLVGRIAHMVFYYVNLKVPRSIAFVASFAGLLGMFVVGLLSWL